TNLSLLHAALGPARSRLHVFDHRAMPRHGVGGRLLLREPVLDGCCPGQARKDATAMTTRLFSLPLFAATALATAMLSTVRAKAAGPDYRWCMQPQGQWGPDCSYVTHEQCAATALAVGFCYENPRWSAAAQSRPERMRRP